MAKKDGIRVHVYGDYDNRQINKAMKDLASLKKEGEKNQTAFSKLGNTVKGFGLSAVGATLGVVGIGAALISFTKGAEDAEIANRKLGNVLEQMGFGEATSRVAAYAETLERTIAVDADVIKSTQTKLATFKNLTESVNEAGGAFDRATLAALDLAAAGFGAAETNAVQLGKALQDPIKGITALARAGVTFTEQEKDKIKTLVEANDTLGAQNLILEAIEKQVGGTAEAGASSFERIRLSAMQVADVIGLALLPFVEAFADFLSNKLVPAITSMSTGIGNLTKFVKDNSTAIISATIAITALTAAMLLNRIGGIAFAAQYATHTIVMGAYTLAANAARIATIALMVAMKAIPFIAIAAAVVGLVTVLDQGAKSQKEWREETKRTLDATNGWKDAQGNATKAAIAYAAANRFSKFAQKDLTKAISGTVGAAVSAGNTLGSTLTPAVYDSADAADEATTSYVAFWEAIINKANAERWADQVKQLSGSVMGAVEQGVRLGGSPVWQKLAEGYGAVKDAADGAAGGASAASSAIDKSAEAAKAAIATYKENFKNVRAYLNESVEDIKSKMADMATSVSASLMRGFQLGDAAEEFGDDGARIGGTFMEKLQAQADKVTGFAAKIKELMALGLNINSPLMKAVIAEGAGTGTAIAQHLIDSGAAGIEQATGMLTAAQGAADEIGTLAATNFYGAGLESAQQTVQAFVDRFGVGGKGRERLMTLMDNLAAAMNRSATITVTTVNRVVNETVGAKSAGKTIVGATGGIVNRPTFALIGEAGPEAVIPLSQSSGNDPLPMIGGGHSNAGTTINLTVNAGMGTQGAEVGRQIVDALKAYERRNGSVYVAA